MKQSDDWRLTDLIRHDQGKADPFAAAIRATRMPMVITNPRLPDNPIVFANEAFQRLTGYGLEELIGNNCRLLQGPGSDPAAVAAVRDAVAQRRPINVDLLNYRKDGSTFWNALYVSPVVGEDGEVQFFFASQLDVTSRIEAQRVVADQKAEVEAQVRARTAALERALAEKTTLLHEVDHRVKNNLTTLGALIRLQSRSIGEPAVRATLEGLMSRVDALAAVHRTLYQTENINMFDLGAFAEALLRDVVASSARSDIDLDVDIEPTEVPARQAAAVGLILNELITNAVKHAFSGGRRGRITLRIHRSDHELVIALLDDGAGFADLAEPSDGIGQTLVQRLSRQIGATTHWDGTEGGVSVTVALPAPPEEVL